MITEVSFLKRFLHDPFATLDKLDLEFYGFQFNVLKSDQKLCDKFILPVMVLIPLILWVFLGSDSTAEQLAFFVWNLPKFALGRITFPEWIASYSNYYGLGTHWSASVIYGLLFVGVSKYFREHYDVVNSENLSLTVGFVGFAIASFEFFWMQSYSIFQGQTWVLSLQYPQLRIILQNIVFILPGLVVIPSIVTSKKYKLNFNWLTWICLFATVSLVLLWWYYPFSTQTLTVPVKGYGIWSSSNNFPQTMYTIDVDISDKIAVGDMFHVEAPEVHFLNNVTKVFWTLTFYSLSQIKEREKRK